MPSPYADLFIYQLEGRMDSRTAIEANTFLGHWQEEDSAFLFFSAPVAEVVEDIVCRQPHLRLVDSTRMPYAHWQGPVFSGVPIGRFHFVAPLETAASADPNDAQALAILLDPGLVFGAGTHPTTRLPKSSGAGSGRGRRNRSGPGHGRRHPCPSGGPAAGRQG